ncbi:MAG: DNA-binding MarR family transcriptional regulator [Kiritimatiellia bacterium]|jgi:DNA-binding MarR family transcriptional regulator
MVDPFFEVKEGNLGQLLLRTARLFDERAYARASVVAPQLRRSHLDLFPHIDLQGTRVTVLAKRMGVSKQAAAVTVADLERLGVVSKHPDPADGRAKVVRLTKSGHDYVSKGLFVLRSVSQDLLEQMDASERDGLLVGLAALQRALDGG